MVFQCTMLLCSCGVNLWWFYFVSRTSRRQDTPVFIWYLLATQWWVLIVKEQKRKWSQNLHGIQKYGAPSKFFSSSCKAVPGAYSDKRQTVTDTWNTPKKCFFSDWKRPKEGERVALGHFHERVGESPRLYENFGTSRSKESRFVSEIWPFEVGIAVRPNFT